MAARALCGEIYRALLSPSEQWLDRHGSSENGPLPKAAAELFRRFDTLQK
jgi:phenylacetic acid degradation operon negative regulatory protein